MRKNLKYDTKVDRLAEYVRNLSERDDETEGAFAEGRFDYRGKLPSFSVVILMDGEYYRVRCAPISRKTREILGLAEEKGSDGEMRVMGAGE